MERPRKTKVKVITSVRRTVLIEAVCYLLITRLLLKFVAFRRLSWFFGLQAKQPEVLGEQREAVISEIRRAIWKANAILPIEIVCFPRAIATQAMLRRRGISTVLYYGALPASRSDKGLTTHAWVQDDDLGVMGYAASKGYHAIARYPEID